EQPPVVQVGVQLDHIDLQLSQDVGQDARGVGVGVVDHQVEIAGDTRQRLWTQRPEEGVGVDLLDVHGVDDAPDLIKVNAPVILAKEPPLDLAFGRAVDVKTVRVKDPNVDDSIIERREPDVDAAGRAGRVRDVARHGDRDAVQLRYMHAGRGQPG